MKYRVFIIMLGVLMMLGLCGCVPKENDTVLPDSDKVSNTDKINV